MIADLVERLRALLLRNRVEADMDEEMRFHVERETEERIRRGVDPARARREAIIAFGGIERRKEEVRDARGVSALENAGSDLRHAGRALLRNPIFAATTVFVLALGVGATAAVYGVAHAVLLADLPYPESQQLVRIYQKYSETVTFGLSVVEVQAIAAQQRSFESFGAMRPGEAAIAVPGRTPEQRGIGRTTAGMFKVLGVRPAAGRFFEERDESAGAEPIVVLSHVLAVRLFGDAPAAVGKLMTLDGVGHTIVGVLPPEVPDIAGYRAAAWRVYRMDPPTRRGPFGIRVLARLKPGATVESATRDLAGISERIFPIWKSSFRDSSAKLTPVPLRRAVLGDQTERRIGLLAGGVALVLLAAIANVAMLVLVRVSSRESELAIRSALGAGRWRLARLLAAEGLLLGVMSAAAGFALAYFLLRLAPATLPTIPRIQQAGADWRVAAAAALLALLAAAVATVAPVLSALARPVATSIAAERRVGSSRRSNLARGVLIATEFGLALPLLVGAALLLNSFARLQRVDPGYDPEGAVAVGIGLPPTRYPESRMAVAFWRSLEQRLRESPIVAAVGISASLPPTEPSDINNFDLKDRPVPTGSSEHVAPWNAVTNGYFEALRVPLLEGRLFTAADTVDSIPERTRSTVVVSRSWARKYYPDVSAVGKQMIAGGCTTCEPTTVIGVVGDVKYMGLTQSSEGVYQSVPQYEPSSANVVVRTRPGATPAAAFNVVRQAVRSLDPEIAVTETTLKRELNDSLADPKRWTTILGAFSLTGALLATVGIFGLMAYTVRQRRREIGVRMALGATASAVVREIVAGGLRWAAIGSAAGLVLSLTTGRWIRTFLFEVEATDPLTLAGVVGLLLATAAFACWLAARRAAQIHPVEAIAAN
jgi:predicted permease